MQQATAIELPFWQAPQNPLAVVLFNSICQVFFALWDYDGNQIPACLGKITFTKCWASNTIATDFLPYYLNPHRFHSYLLEVEDSAWLAAQSQTRLATYPNWKSWDDTAYHHYVMEGAENYVEVLAASFVAEMATDEECRHYAFLLE